MAPRRLTYANVMATLAFFVAIGGVSYAAINVPEDSIGSKELKDNAVHTVNLHRNSVDERALKPNAISQRVMQGNAVGPDQLAPGSVNSRAINDKSVTSDDLDPTAAVPRLFAHVTSSGNLGEAAGVESVNKQGTGTYFVRFNRDLHGCVAVASVGFGFGTGAIGAGATAQTRTNADNDPMMVRVTTYKGGGTTVRRHAGQRLPPHRRLLTSQGSTGSAQRRSAGASRMRSTFAGMPPTTAFAGTSRVTTE